jgi:hypothetical protein
VEVGRRRRRRRRRRRVEEGGQPWLQVGSWLAAGGERRRKVWLDIMIEILVSIS